MARLSEVPAPENVPPVNNPDPQPGDGKPKMPPSEDGRQKPPVELLGNRTRRSAWAEARDR